MTNVYHLIKHAIGRVIAAGVGSAVLLALLVSCSSLVAPGPDPATIAPNVFTASSLPDIQTPWAPTSIAQTGVVWTTPVPRRPVASAVPSATPSATPTSFVEETAPRTPSVARTPSATASATPPPDEEETDTPTPSEEPTLDPRPVIPNVVGLDEQQARARLSRLDSSIQINVIRWTDVCEDDGLVLQTNPPAGEPIDYGSVVELTVCERLEPTDTPTPTEALPATMPDLYGWNEQEARVRLMQINPSLTIEVVRHIAPCDYDGMIVSTSPAAGQPVASDTSVVLTLCLRPTPTVVSVPSPTPVPEPPTPVPSDKIMPDVIGMHPDEALQVMQKLDFQTEFYLVSSDCEREQVVETNPIAGTTLVDGMIISIGVCAPPPDN